MVVISTSPSKEAEAKSLGASKFVIIKDNDACAAHAGTLNFIIDTGKVHVQMIHGNLTWFRSSCLSEKADP